MKDDAKLLIMVLLVGLITGILIYNNHTNREIIKAQREHIRHLTLALETYKNVRR